MGRWGVERVFFIRDVEMSRVGFLLGRCRNGVFFFGL